ncbi:translation initiation factor IF-2-like [Ursus americanus]|uniref:translation initiation factor IF-2-like n=1 Tax=Ursus americanus TaxID=9643 RepID=UPI001E67AD45|nr:translation initiation factor IF-2-like [Ursus americanus]
MGEGGLEWWRGQRPGGGSRPGTGSEARAWWATRAKPPGHGGPRSAGPNSDGPRSLAGSGAPSRRTRGRKPGAAAPGGARAPQQGGRAGLAPPGPGVARAGRLPFADALPPACPPGPGPPRPPRGRIMEMYLDRGAEPHYISQTAELDYISQGVLQGKKARHLVSKEFCAWTAFRLQLQHQLLPDISAACPEDLDLLASTTMVDSLKSFCVRMCTYRHTRTHTCTLRFFVGFIFLPKNFVN